VPVIVPPTLSPPVADTLTISADIVPVLIHPTDGADVTLNVPLVEFAEPVTYSPHQVLR
jgi:hypothetical protein